MGRQKGRNALIASARFWDDEFATARFEDYAAGRFKGWSINLLPKDQSPPTAEGRRARPDWARAKIVYREGTLVEVSAVTCPGNPSALTLSVERHVSSFPTVNPLGLTGDALAVIRAMPADRGQGHASRGVEGHASRASLHHSDGCS